MHWVDKMLLEYKEGRRDLRKQLKGLGDTEKDQEDKTLLNSMIKDMSFIIEWLEVGRMPDLYRGVDKRSAYQKSALVNMDLFPCLEIEPEEKPLTDDQKKIILDVLARLSIRERECFILSKANRRTQEEIAEELGISRMAVRTNLKRAEDKIEKYIKGGKKGIIKIS
ncbi:sigma-70 family RNA polymerase sigma factor [Virgibacillus sp. Bac332]|uniref:sigma-70 family RNA polymerase sigma factor n=1 Tax=Virgibacillus sp. Bac332 TaxID=2419842 RepID=UPI000EF505AF|nr:sigma-70 family RNA polymerase sigma factor [Virgibacillus sp. Bac332]